MRRREVLKHSLTVAGLLAVAGIFPRAALAFTRAAFETRSIADAVKAYGGMPPVESKSVTLTAPEIAENGATVPLAIASTLPGVKHMLLLVEKNPNVLVAKFDVSDAIEANFSIRAKMDQSSNVYAVAITEDGRAHFARRDVKVTLGGCGN